MSFTMDDMLAIVKPYNDKLIAESKAARLERSNAELLASCKALRAELDALRWGQRYPAGRPHAVMDAAEAAIAKATSKP